MKTIDSCKIVVWNCILNFNEEQVYLEDYLSILKIKRDMTLFLF